MFLSPKCCFRFCAFGFETILYTSCYSLPLWIKPTMGQFIAPFSVQLLQLLSCVGGALETNLFSLLLIDRYVLAIQQIATHQEHLSILICRDLLNCLRSRPFIINNLFILTKKKLKQKFNSSTCKRN